MTEPSGSPPRGGGAFLALAILGGAAIGIATGQPSIGIIGGVLVGIAAIGFLFLRR